MRWLMISTGLLLVEMLFCQSMDIEVPVTIYNSAHVTGRLDVSSFLNVDGSASFSSGGVDMASLNVSNIDVNSSADFLGQYTTVSHPAVTGGDAGLVIENSEVLTEKRWWRFYVQHGDGDLLLYNSVSGSTNGIAGEFNASTGTYSSMSDRRLKKNFEKTHLLLPKLIGLDVYKYHMISEDADDSKHYGLIAQEVQEYFPELVHYDAESDIYKLEYSSLGVLAIQAIKEQQEIIEKQDHEIKEIRKILEHLITQCKSQE